MLTFNKISIEDFSHYLLHEFGLAINTAKSYESDLKAFLAWYSDKSCKKNLSAINKKIVYDYLISRLNLGINVQVLLEDFCLHLSFLIVI